MEQPKVEAPPLPGPTPAALAPAPASPSWAWAVESSGGFRFRAPSVSSWEVAGGLRYGPLLLAASYQPEARWNLQGRPVGLSSAGFTAGARFEVFEGRGFYGGVLGGARIEWLRLHRRDLTAGQVFHYWDAGVSAGLLGGYRLLDPSTGSGSSLGVELRAEVVYLPTGRIISVPDGPSGMLNRVGLRATACFYWDFWRG
jgi:hypothetical protein